MGFTNEMPKHSYLKSAHPFKIFAHRGLCFRNGELIHDENTIAAFREAVAQGIEYIELDVQSSQDRKAVVFHDDRLDRVSEVEGLICDKKLTEIQSLSLKLGGKISTLEEIFAALPANCKINIDIKNDAAIADVVSTIIRNQAENRVLVTSFSEKRRTSALAALPGVATSPSASLVLRIWLFCLLGLNSAKLLNLVNVLQIPVSYWLIRFDSPRFIESVKRHGVELVYWTVNDPAEAMRLWQLGANGIVTDRSDLMAAAILNR